MLNDIDGIALALVFACGGFVLLLGALVIELVMNTDREWIRRLRRIEQGRKAQGSER